MADETYVTSTTTAPSVQNGTMRWAAAMSINSSALANSFFDFDWTALFKAKSGNADPLSIIIVSNPAGGAFKSTLVPNPVIMPLGGIEFNTVRIIKLLPAVAGTYTFTYNITDTTNTSTTATLTLTLA